MDARRVAEVAKQRADIDALEKAAGDGDLDTIRRLLDAGVDVNVVGPDHNTPLIRAVFKNRLEAAQLLLDRGAQVDKPRLSRLGLYAAVSGQLRADGRTAQEERGQRPRQAVSAGT